MESAVFRVSGKRKYFPPQACFQLLLCWCKAGRLNYFWRLPKLCVCSLVAGYLANLWLPFSVVAQGAALVLFLGWI